MFDNVSKKSIIILIIIWSGMHLKMFIGIYLANNTLYEVNSAENI